MRKRWWLNPKALLLLGPAALGLLAVLFLVFEHVRGSVSLNRYKRELAARGVKLTPKELMQMVSPEENGVPAITAARSRLRDGSVLPKYPPQRMKMLPSGKAVVGFRNSEWVDDKVTNRWDQLAQDLKANEAPLEGIRLALNRPVLNNLIDYNLWPDLSTSLFHLGPAKNLTYWYGSRIQLALHEGRSQDALPDLLAEARLPRLLAEDKLVISELVRIAVAAIGRVDVWESLQAQAWKDEDLAALHGAWASDDFIKGMDAALQGELVFGETEYAKMRESNAAAAEDLFSMANFLGSEGEVSGTEKTLRNLPGGEEIVKYLQRNLYCPIWRFAWLDQNDRRYLEFMTRIFELSQEAAKEKSYAGIKLKIDTLLKHSVPENIYDRLRFPNTSSEFTLARALLRPVRAETERSQTLCAIALKRYELRHGKAPASLDALVPEFLASVPIDYMDGKPMKYRLNPDGTFTLYSVGEDGIDNGGDTATTDPKGESYGPWKLKDAVWPAPATREEILEAEKKRKR
jgi:hypothetical protein